MIPAKNIPLLKVFMSKEVDADLLQVIHSGYIGEGQKVQDFEAAVSARCNFSNFLATNSCTSALQLALRLAGVASGDVVLSTPATNMATNSVIKAAGASPYWVDIDPHTGQVDPAKLPKRPPNGAKALMIMDWGGVPCDLDALCAYTQKHGLKLIEDAAHAFGAKYRGRWVGQVADFTCFSFQAVKQLTTGDGGGLVCHNPEDYRRGRLLRWFGIDRSNPTNQRDLRCEAPIHEWGYKFHMNDIAATIGLANLKYFDYIVRTARENAAYYTTEITKLNHPSLEPMEPSLDTEPTYWLYTLKVTKKRDEFADALREQGIACSKVHSRNDRHPCMPVTEEGDLPGVDEFYRTQLSIPVGYWVTDKDRQYVMSAITKNLNILEV